jgi:hypothetical protein
MRFTFRPQLEEMESRIVPATTVPTLGHSPVVVALTATQDTTQLAIVVPNGNTVQVPPQPVAPPNPIDQAVIAFETTNGVPPSPCNPGLLVAAGFITPSAGL